jgi:cysteine desulfurase
MSSPPIYLDYAATTPLDKRVLAAMLPFLQEDEGFGNASSEHYYGHQALAAQQCAAEQVATAVGVPEARVVWTSGATEANNLALLGIARFYAKRGNHIVTSAQEHASILEPCRELAKSGMRVTYLQPQADGRLSLDALANAITADTLLISLAHANSETGVVQDLQEIGAIATKKGVLLHIDAAQSAGKLELPEGLPGVALVSLSAHKNYGPKGIGALVFTSKSRVHCQPLFFGGAQQAGLRPGTFPTASIVGMGEAFALSQQLLPSEVKRMHAYCDRLRKALVSLSGVTVNGSSRHRLAHNLNLRIEGVHGDALNYATPELVFSQGAACSASQQAPSAVLQAMGLTVAQARDSIRLTIGRFTTSDDIDKTVRVLCRAIQRLRACSPC